MAVRKENASKFSFTRAHLSDDIYGPEFIMDNDFQPSYAHTVPWVGREYDTREHSVEDSHYGTNNTIKNVADDWLEQADLGAHHQFAYTRRELPKTNIDRQINQYEHMSEKNANDGKLVLQGRGLEYEIKRPEVFELFKKYYTEGSKLADDILSNASSENFADDEDEQRKRFDYRQKVENHYKRLMKEGIMIHDPEGLGSRRGSEGFPEPPPDFVNYQPGITESDWKAIDHHRSLSQEKEKDQLSCGEYESPGRPSALKQTDGGDKKKKKVRVRRHDSLIKCDSEPDLASKMKTDLTLAANREDALGGGTHFYDDFLSQGAGGDNNNQGRGRSRLTSRPPSFPGSRPRASTSVPASPRRHRPPNSSHSWRGVSPSSESSSRNSSPKGSPRRALHKQDSSDDFFVHFRRREPSESSDRSSRIDPQTYQSYAAGILHSSRKSEPFLRLQKYYATVERITEIEQCTLQTNEMSGRKKYNTVSLKALSKLHENDPREVEGILLSKYKLESLEELQDLYRDLDEAKAKEEFFFDTTNLDELQWNPWKDRGLKSKEVTINELYNIYERGRAARNTHVVRRRKNRDDIRRELSFDKLFEKYHYLDETSRKEKVLAEWWGQRSLSRRGSDASSVMSAGSLIGSYIQIMEHAARKSKERPMYGYHIDEEPNKYEIHIDNLRRMSKSCPDVSEKSLHVRSESQPEPSGHDKDKTNPLIRSDSFKQSSFAASDDEKERFYRVQPRQRAALRGSPRTSVETRDIEIVRTSRPASGRSSESGYDSIDGRSPKSTATPEKDRPKKGHMDIHDLVSDTGHLSVNTPRDIQAYPVQWQNRSQVSRPQDLSSKQGQNQWRGEIRGIVGKEQRRPGDAPSHPSQPRAATTEYRPSITRSSDVFLDDDLKERARRMRIREENFRERQRWRKDSKPNPGAVASALSIFEKNQLDKRSREKSVPNWKMQSKNLPSSTAGLQDDILREESFSPVTSYRSNSGNRADPQLPHQSPRDGDRTKYWKSFPSDPRVDSRIHEARPTESSPPDRPALPTSSVYSTAYLQPSVSQIQNVHKKTNLSVIGKDITPSTVTAAKSRLERVMDDPKPIPKSALQQKSKNTPLGRYEAKIRSRSEVKSERPKSAVMETAKNVDNSSLRRKDLSKSTPSLNENYIPAPNLSQSSQNQTDHADSQPFFFDSPDGGLPQMSSADIGYDEEPIYASILRKDKRQKDVNKNTQYADKQYGVGQDEDQTYRSSPHSTSYHDRYQGDGATYGQPDAGQHLQYSPSNDAQYPSYNPYGVTDEDTGEDETLQGEPSGRDFDEEAHFGYPGFYDDSLAHANIQSNETMFTHQPKPIRMDGRPFALAGLNIANLSSEEQYPSPPNKYTNLTDFRKEIEDEYRKMYDITKQATLYEPTENFSSLPSEDHLQHSYYGSLSASSDTRHGSELNRRRPASQDELLDPHDVLSGSNDTLVIIGSDPDIANSGSGKSFGSVKMMKNVYESSKLEKSQSEPNLSQDHLDECGVSLNARSDGEMGGNSAHSPDFLNIRAKYESGYVSEESSPQKEYRSPLRDPDHSHLYGAFRPSAEGQTQPTATRQSQSRVTGAKSAIDTRNPSPRKDVPSPRHPWDIVRSSSPKIYDPKKSLNVLEDLGQEWERDKYKLSQKARYQDRSRSYPESVLSQDEGMPTSPEPQVAKPKPVTPQNRPPHPPPYVPPPEIKPSQRRNNPNNKTNKPSDISNKQPTSPPSQTWAPPYSQSFKPLDPGGSAQLSSTSSAIRKQSCQQTETGATLSDIPYKSTVPQGHPLFS